MADFDKEQARQRKNVILDRVSKIEQLETEYTELDQQLKS